MSGNGVAALIAAIILGFVVRVFNVVVEWLATVLGVTKPEPIPTPEEQFGPKKAAP